MLKLLQPAVLPCDCFEDMFHILLLACSYIYIYANSFFVSVSALVEGLGG